MRTMTVFCALLLLQTGLGYAARVANEATEVRESKAGSWTSILLTNHGNVSYTGDIFVGAGDKPQRLRCVFDTGSTNTWITSTVQEHEGDITGKHQLYNPELSSSFCGSDHRCTIKFGSGQLNGFFGWEDVWLNHDRSSNGDIIHIPQQQLGFVQKANVFDSRFDCIVGLAYKRMAAKNTVPFIDNMM